MAAFPDPAKPVERHNNFGVSRLLLSVLVLISHSFPLTRGNNDTEPLFRLSGGSATGGGVAVDCFFLFSGYLVTQSWFRSGTASSYLRKRLLRLMPGYMVAVVASVTVAALSVPADAYTYLREIAYQPDALIRILFFMDARPINNPRAFTWLPYPNTVNGSLWTLRPELTAYLILMGLGVSGLLIRGRLVAVMATCYVWFVVAEARFGNADLSTTRLLTHFIVGSVFALSSPLVIRLNVLRSAVALIVLAAACTVPHLFGLVFPVVGGYLVLGIATSEHAFAPRFFARHDLSYGIYLYAFVVQQTLIFSLGIRNPWLLSLYALPICLALAACSWHWIEKPALAMKHERRGVSSAP